MSESSEFPAFEAQLQRIRDARDLWRQAAGLANMSGDIEEALVRAQWQRSLPGDELVDALRSVIFFLNPPEGEMLSLVLWECCHRLKGGSHRKTRVDLRSEELLQSSQAAQPANSG